MSHACDMPAVDYGFGTFEGEPLVLVGTECFHRHNHAGRILGATFTESYANHPHNYWRRCRVCWPNRSMSGET